MKTTFLLAVTGLLFLMGFAAYAAPPGDFDAVVDAVSFTEVVEGFTAVATVLAVLYVAIVGFRFILRTISGQNDPDNDGSHVGDGHWTNPDFTHEKAAASAAEDRAAGLEWSDEKEDWVEK